MSRHLRKNKQATNTPWRVADVKNHEAGQVGVPAHTQGPLLWTTGNAPVSWSSLSRLSVATQCFAQRSSAQAARLPRKGKMLHIDASAKQHHGQQKSTDAT